MKSTILAATSAFALLALSGLGCDKGGGPSAQALEDYASKKGSPSLSAEPRGAAAPTGEVPGLASPTSAELAPTPTPKPKPATRVRITVIGATGLPDLDDGPGVTDPYVKLEYEGQRLKTSIAEGNLEPTWGDSFLIDIKPGAIMQTHLMDHDSLGSDETLGVLSIELPKVAPGEKETLSLAYREGTHGTVTLEVEGVR